MKLKQLLRITVLALCMVSTVQADIFGFDTITTNTPERELVADQLFIEAITVSASSSILEFTNIGPVDSSVKKIWFGSDLTTLNLSIDSLTSCSGGVSFSVDTSDNTNPPGWEEFANWWSITIAAADADAPPSQNGIDPGECLDVELSYTSGSMLSELIANGELQVALHVISIGENEGSDTFVNGTTVIPEPASLVLLGSVGSLLGFIRKRFAA